MDVRGYCNERVEIGLMVAAYRFVRMCEKQPQCLLFRILMALRQEVASFFGGGVKLSIQDYSKIFTSVLER